MPFVECRNCQCWMERGEGDHWHQAPREESDAFCLRNAPRPITMVPPATADEVTVWAPTTGYDDGCFEGIPREGHPRITAEELERQLDAWRMEHGKSPQAITGEDGGPVALSVSWLAASA